MLKWLMRKMVQRTKIQKVQRRKKIRLLGNTEWFLISNMPWKCSMNILQMFWQFSGNVLEMF